MTDSTKNDIRPILPLDYVLSNLSYRDAKAAKANEAKKHRDMPFQRKTEQRKKRQVERTNADSAELSALGGQATRQASSQDDPADERPKGFTDRDTDEEKHMPETPQTPEPKSMCCRVRSGIRDFQRGDANSKEPVGIQTDHSVGGPRAANVRKETNAGSVTTRRRRDQRDLCPGMANQSRK